MRSIPVLTACVFFACGAAACASSPAATPSPSPTRPAYTVPVDDENWSFLRDPAKRTDRFDALKYIRIGRDPLTYLSLGADAREKYEHYFNAQFDPRLGSNAYLLQRYLGDVDLHHDRVRAFAEIEQSTISGGRGAPDPLNGTSLDFTSLFGEVALGGATGSSRPPFTLRYGRFVMAYGSGRIIDAREGLNARQAFQGVRDRSYAGHWRVDAFLVSPVTAANGAFADRDDRTSHLWGVYATDTTKSTLELYYIGDQRQRVIYDRGTGNEVRHALGARSAGRAGRLDGDIELDYQFGSFRGGPIGAYSIAGSTGYTMPLARGNARLGIDAGIGTGDHDPNAARMTAFRAPYPSGLTFGIVRANGPENVSGFALTQLYAPSNRLTLTTKEFVYERQSLVDGIYVPAGFPLRPPGDSGAVRIGSAGFASAAYTVDRHLGINAAYARYLVGPYMQSVGPAKGVPSASISYFTLFTEYKI